MTSQKKDVVYTKPVDKLVKTSEILEHNIRNYCETYKLLETYFFHYKNKLSEDDLIIYNSLVETNLLKSKYIYKFLFFFPKNKLFDNHAIQYDKNWGQNLDWEKFRNYPRYEFRISHHLVKLNGSGTEFDYSEIKCHIIGIKNLLVPSLKLFINSVDEKIVYKDFVIDCLMHLRVFWPKENPLSRAEIIAIFEK